MKTIPDTTSDTPSNTTTLPNTPLPFESDETAVLLHQQGGRLFTVAFVDKNSYREDTGSFRVYEKLTYSGQPRFSVWSSQLVKTKNVADAISLVARLELLHELHRQRVRESEQERDKAFRDSLERYRQNYAEFPED